MADKKEWRGTATKLLSELETFVRRPEREAELALALAKSAARSGSRVYDKFLTDEERAREKAKNEEAARKVAEAMVALKEARDRAHTIRSGKWPKAGNALSRRLKELGPQLRGDGIHILWPTSHGDGKVLTVTNIIFGLRKKENTRETSSSSTSSTHCPNDATADCSDGSDLDDDSHATDESRYYGERSTSHRPEDDVSAFDPGFMPDEPDQPDWSSGSPSSTKPNGASAQNKPHSSKLRDKDEGYAI
jgi:hypothetical protein